MRRLMIWLIAAVAVSSSLVGAPTVAERLTAFRQDEMLLEYLGKEGLEKSIGCLDQYRNLDTWGDLRWNEWRFSCMAHSLKSDDPLKKEIISIFWNHLHEFNASIAADIEQGGASFIGKNDFERYLEQWFEPKFDLLLDDDASEEDEALVEMLGRFNLWLVAISQKDIAKMKGVKKFFAQSLGEKAENSFPELIRIVREALLPWMEKVDNALEAKEETLT